MDEFGSSNGLSVKGYKASTVCYGVMLFRFCCCCCCCFQCDDVFVFFISFATVTDDGFVVVASRFMRMVMSNWTCEVRTWPRYKAD